MRGPAGDFFDAPLREGGTGTGHPFPCREPVILGMKLAAGAELACMSRSLHDSACSRQIGKIRRYLDALLDEAKILIDAGIIDPSRGLRLRNEDEEGSPEDRRLRLGIFPVKADPIHWGHILSGLSAIIFQGLDRVVYLFTADEARRLPPALRLNSGMGAVEAFSPLLSFSPDPITECGEGDPGVFKLLDLNPFTPIEAFYIAGCRHLRQRNLIENLENAAALRFCDTSPDGGQYHSLSFLFIEPEDAPACPSTFLPRRSMPVALPEASSGDILDALAGGRDTFPLSMLPYTVFTQIQKTYVPHEGGAHAAARRPGTPW